MTKKGHRQKAGTFRACKLFPAVYPLTLGNKENSIWRRSRLDMQRKAKTTTFALNTRHKFYPKRPFELVDIQKSKYGRRVQVQKALFAFNHFSRSCHLLRVRNKGYSDAPGSFLSGGNCHFTAHLHALNLAAVISIERRRVR